MKTVIRHLAAAGLLALAAGTASAGVTVNYIEPDRFSDVPFASWERDETLKELTEHFAKLGAELPPGQDLRIDVKDIDLAGREYPTRGVRDLRVVRSNGADWPRIDLHYTVEQDDRVLRSGEAQLRDMAFMDRIGRANDSDSLRFEKRMIDDWFYSTIMPRERAARR
ncbi:DUF3016 domain-containing protein [Massilia sp.]|uniref:DUF3016 domain-containing protein n=1 Tax=Massilia sp. TaxID=1882437 RepID=UPI0028A12CC2|nr:DUF3016 domain-containing protein [Massilia sp.]